MCFCWLYYYVQNILPSVWLVILLKHLNDHYLAAVIAICYQSFQIRALWGGTLRARGPYRL